MFAHVHFSNPNDYFTELNNRSPKGVYFYRVSGYTHAIGEFISKYNDAAKKNGVIIEGKLPNPDEKNLSYYNEIMGMEFELSIGFISESLKKWMPRMNEIQSGNVAGAMYDMLEDLRQAGKNENMLKNAYIKFMCWLYYRFERIANMLGNSNVPKILYEGEISNYELLMLRILSNAGCDILLLQYNGDDKYLALDRQSKISDPLEMDNMTPFPEDFSLKQLRERDKLYGELPDIANCTNAWITGSGLDDIRKDIALRGNDDNFFYNSFYRINGVWDKLTYVNDLYQLYLELKNNKRQIVVVNDAIAKPSNEEIACVRRGNYVKTNDMLSDISSNIKYSGNAQLQKLLVKAFMDVMLEDAKSDDVNINKLTGRAVYIVCWIKRYMAELFTNWKQSDIACFIHMGPIGDEVEGLFMKFLARLPVDVLILNPNLNTKCLLSDSLLYEINYEESMPLMRYPQDKTDIQMGTVAYQAERELDTLLYKDSGIYRNMQYGRAGSIILKTMYEEIFILWKEELKYRPNFSTDNGLVTMPVIFAKVSGIKDGDIPKYWNSIRELMTDDTLVIRRAPFIDNTKPNPIKPFATEFFKNGKLLKNKVKENANYEYGVIREEMQEHILDKIQLLIDQKTIKGTGENGTEYTIISTALNMPKEIIRVIQKFDFTKTNPKLIYINTGEKVISLEDSILTALLCLIGFDVVFFVPTGYQSVEKYFNNKLIEEHQLGNFVYDLTVPTLTPAPSNTHKSLRDRLFNRKGV
jgi:hypothetical protein